MATRRIVPRNDGEGAIGKPAKRWGDVQTKKINGIFIAEDGAATTSTAGLMSASDKVKLDGVPSPVEGDAGKLVAVKGDESGYETVAPYTLPTASADTLGGVKVADPVTVTEGVLGVSSATTSAAGLMSASDKTKLDGVSANAIAALAALTIASIESY